MTSQNGPTLALDSAAYGEARGLRRREDIIDSLAYIDTISDAEKVAAENLIKEEVRSSRLPLQSSVMIVTSGHLLKFLSSP